LEHLSDAPFLGKLLVLPANVRLDWKVIATYKHSSLFGLVVSKEGKKFCNIDTKSKKSKSLSTISRKSSSRFSPPEESSSIKISLNLFFRLIRRSDSPIHPLKICSRVDPLSRNRSNSCCRINRLSIGSVAAFDFLAKSTNFWSAKTTSRVKTRIF